MKNKTNFNSNKILLFKIYLLMGFFFFSSKINASELIEEGLPEIIIIHNNTISKSEKEALLILPGLGDKKKRRKYQREYFEQLEYDLFIPNYADRKSFDNTVKNFTRFFEEQKLGEYKKVHVFAYILGSWVLNIFINENGRQNITTIIYDRSPLQERAPQVAHDKMPLITRMTAGKIIKDFTKEKYSPIEQGDIRIGIIVENKATPLIRFFRKKAMSYGAIDWKHLDFNQSSDDIIFTLLNHNEMYSRFDIIGNDVLHFIEKGSFTKEARRVPYDWDVFKKYKESK